MVSAPAAVGGATVQEASWPEGTLFFSPREGGGEASKVSGGGRNSRTEGVDAS